MRIFIKQKLILLTELSKQTELFFLLKHLTFTFSIWRIHVKLKIFTEFFYKKIIGPMQRKENTARSIGLLFFLQLIGTYDVFWVLTTKYTTIFSLLSTIFFFFFLENEKRGRLKATISSSKKWIHWLPFVNIKVVAFITKSLLHLLHTTFSSSLHLGFQRRLFIFLFWRLACFRSFFENSASSHEIIGVYRNDDHPAFYLLE